MQNDIKKVLSSQELKEMQRARMKLMKKRYWVLDDNISYNNDIM
jgi:hypothetical protein